MRIDEVSAKACPSSYLSLCRLVSPVHLVTLRWRVTPPHNDPTGCSPGPDTQGMLAWRGCSWESLDFWLEEQERVERTKKFEQKECSVIQWEFISILVLLFTGSVSSWNSEHKARHGQELCVSSYKLLLVCLQYIYARRYNPCTD